MYFSTFDIAQETELEITKENMTIYNLFTKLFNSFEKCEIFQEDKLNQRLKSEYIYRQIYDGKKITWISDDSVFFDYQTADAMRITKETDWYKLKFTYYENEFPHLRSIRIRNARSRYKPFNMLMMDFFNSLQEYDPDFHQFHLEEYLFNKNQDKQLIRK